MKAFLIFVILSTLVSSSFCQRSFHNGRLRRRNLGVQRFNEIRSDARNFSRWFTQTLDHFDVTNQDTWEQRYNVNDEFFDKSKRDVVFLLVGDEGVIKDLWMTRGDWIEKAKTHKALLLNLEHRFYGRSFPTKDLSVENLKYLSIDQSLADHAVFVNGMKTEYKLSPTVKFIAFGGSYGGSIAAWSRLKYPHLIHGAVSSSAPLRAVVDFQDFYQVIDDNLRNTDENCLAAVQKGTAQIDALIGKKSGQETLTELFQLCDPLSESADNENDISNFYLTLADRLAVIIQHNKNNKLVPGALPDNKTLDAICDIMTDSSLGDEVTRLAKLHDIILKDYGQSCLDYRYDNFIESMRNISFYSTADDDRQWMFQTCTEFGFFQTSNKWPHVFGNKFPTKFFIQQCIDIFGPKFNDTFLTNAIRRTNTLYGGIDIKVSNVVFVHGSVDPWHPLGITKTKHREAPAIFIKGSAHMANIFPQAETDSPQLKAARKNIGKLIQHWLHS